MRKGSHCSEETRAKLSLLKKGTPLSEEHHRHVAAANRKRLLGTHFSEEHKKKLSEALVGKKRCVSEEGRRRMLLAHLGTHHTTSDETRAKLRKPKSAEMRAKLSAAHLGTHHTTSEEARRHLSEAQKRVGNQPPHYTGEHHYKWRGGKLPDYVSHWPTISRQELAAAEGICCWPGCTKKAMGTHHIDGNKQNNRRGNLLPLCDSHHAFCDGKKRDLLQLECMEIQRLRGLL